MSSISNTFFETHSDRRGILTYLNTDWLTKVVRLYCITPSDTNVIRGWQGHLKESKWFICTKGIMEIDTAIIDAEINLLQENTKFVLQSNIPSVLYVPGGHATAIRAFEKNSTLMVFSNFSTEESKKDDLRFDLNKSKILEPK